MLDLSVVIPVYKSASTLQELHRRLAEICQKESWQGEIIYVNDCSPDHSLEILKSLPPLLPFRIIGLKHNLGQSSALLTGIHFAEGRFIATMDADLQDEPEFLPVMMKHFNAATDLIFARRSGQYESIGRLSTSFLFKSIITILSKGSIPMNAGLFFMMRGNTKERITAFLPGSPYLIGAIAKAKLRCSAVAVARKHNALGETSYTFRKRIQVATRFLDTLRMKPLSEPAALSRWLNEHIQPQ